MYETVAGGNRANGSFAYRYGIQRESYSYEAAATTAGSRAFDSLSISQSGSYYYDGYGSVSNLSAGEDSISYTYDAYGNMQKTGTYGEISTDSSAYGSPYGYNGEYSHALTGLQYLRARYYQASTGSFISKDSYAGNIRNILSANRYTYGENNPLGYADPSGHSVLSKIKSAVSSAVNTVKNTVSKAVTSVRNAVSSAVNALHHTSNAVSTAVSNTGRTIANGVAQKKAQLSAIKADIVSNVSSTYDRASAAAGRMYGKIAAGVSQAKAAINEGIYTAANEIHEMERKACKAYEACKNVVQEKVKSMDWGRLVNGTLLIVGGAGKIMGAVGLAVISLPFCAGGIGIGGEIAAGIVAAAGGSDIAEGIQEIMYGWNGDSESESFNLVRDTLYAGNERAYEISTGIAATCGDIGLSLVKNAINKAAEEAFESKLKKELTEQAAKTAAKEAEDVAEKTVQNSAKEALKDTVKNNVDDAIEEATEAVQKNLDDVVKDASGVEKISEGGRAPDFYVGPNGKALPSQYKDWIGTNIQKELLEQAENPQLQNAIKQLYRDNSFIGDGGTADVIRFEQQTGLMLGKNGGSHVQKGIDMAKYIENRILTQDLSPLDTALATQLLENLYSALGG